MDDEQQRNRQLRDRSPEKQRRHQVQLPKMDHQRKPNSSASQSRAVSSASEKPHAVSAAVLPPFFPESLHKRMSQKIHPISVAEASLLPTPSVLSSDGSGSGGPSGLSLLSDSKGRHETQSCSSNGQKGLDSFNAAENSTVPGRFSTPPRLAAPSSSLARGSAEGVPHHPCGPRHTLDRSSRTTSLSGLPLSRSASKASSGDPPSFSFRRSSAGFIPLLPSKEATGQAQGKALAAARVSATEQEVAVAQGSEGKQAADSIFGWGLKSLVRVVNSYMRPQQYSPGVPLLHGRRDSTSSLILDEELATVGASDGRSQSSKVAPLYPSPLPVNQQGQRYPPGSQTHQHGAVPTIGVWQHRKSNSAEAPFFGLAAQGFILGKQPTALHETGLGQGTEGDVAPVEKAVSGSIRKTLPAPPVAPAAQRPRKGANSAPAPGCARTRKEWSNAMPPRPTPSVPRTPRSNVAIVKEAPHQLAPTVQGSAPQVPKPLLPPMEQDAVLGPFFGPAASIWQGPLPLKRKTLVLDLDETLVHSTFHCPTEMPPDFVIPILIEGRSMDVYVVKRPGVHQFLEAMARLFEVVVFTASMPRYADPLLDLLDPSRELFHHRLFRDACSPLSRRSPGFAGAGGQQLVQQHGGFVKDLSRLGRDLSTTLLVDNSPQCFSWQPENGLLVPGFYNDRHDRLLLRLIPFLSQLATANADVRLMLRRAHFTGSGAHPGMG